MGNGTSQCPPVRRRAPTGRNWIPNTQIIAPLSGRSDRHMISPGNLVQADQTELTTIVALDHARFLRPPAIPPQAASGRRP
ncbi:multidrug efflux pump subunit AcrA (membrane-fusion protein) [Rhizobium azooxidifex]|uniref:Multidrug efflux pump subunit AcrA (Membrane-fusion protein) n=1 Tax=Mycoplana azooxidifex TaxID=1636188 RepID=A0A7W6DAP4_9HYPH|nr:multidrug efflux pump subunit AcrA (membrane-fusion protein) [Mycoplana azooxidifex]